MHNASNVQWITRTRCRTKSDSKIASRAYGDRVRNRIARHKLNRAVPVPEIQALVDKTVACCEILDEITRTTRWSNKLQVSVSGSSFDLLIRDAAILDVELRRGA